MPITCRARVHDRCFGEDVEERYPAGEDPRDDGTYDPKTNTLVCDYCYAALMPYTPSGQALTHELDDAIQTLRLMQQGNMFT